MKPGAELITIERNEKQICKHGFTGKHHADHPEWYDKGQLAQASSALSKKDIYSIVETKPINWNLDWWSRMCEKPHLERLVMAGAMLASEIDRLNEIECRNNLKTN